MGFSRVLFGFLALSKFTYYQRFPGLGVFTGMCVQGVCMSVFILCSCEDLQGTSCPPESLLACGKSHTFGISLNRSHLFFPPGKGIQNWEITMSSIFSDTGFNRQTDSLVHSVPKLSYLLILPLTEGAE